MFDCTQDWYKVWRKTGWCFQKLTRRIWQFFTRALESLQIGTLMASFCLKLKMYELKIYRGVLCHDNEEWCKIWRGIDLSVQNWHEEFDEFCPEHSKISNIYTLMDWFWPKYIMFQLKRYRGVMFDCTQDWYKVWRKTGLCFQKLTWGIWQIFTRALENLKNLHFNRLLLTQVNNVWAKKKYRGVMFDGTKYWCNIWRKNWLVLWNVTWGI